MEVMTCRIGQPVTLGDGSRIVLQARMGRRVALAVNAPAGTPLWLGGARLAPLRDPQGWAYVFSLQALRHFRVGRLLVQVWLPGDVVPHAADCVDAVHLGVEPAHTARLSRAARRDNILPLPLPAASALPHTPLDGASGAAGAFAGHR